MIPDSSGSERILPFDPLAAVDQPRSSGSNLEQGLLQRLEAIDCFLADIYGHPADPQRQV